MVFGKRSSRAPRRLASDWKLPLAPQLCGPWRLGTAHASPLESRRRWPSPPQYASSAQSRLATGFLHYKRKESVEEPRPRRKSRKHRGSGPTTPRAERPAQILVVDATELRDYWNRQKQHAGDGSHNDRKAAGLGRDVPTPRKTVLRIKNPYAVPCCYGPNDMMNTPNSFQQQQQWQHQQQQQQQQWQQQWQHQHHHQLQHHQPQHYQPQHHQQQHHQLQQLQRPTMMPPRETQPDDPLSSPKYAVPLESLYSNPKPGSRYCGNFYYI